MMKERGHYIIHYGHEDSNVICDEHVTVSTNKDLEIAYGNYDWRNNFFKFDVEDHAYQTFFKNAIEEVGKRKQPRDFILPFWGSGVRPICDAHQDMICVEPGIGYAGGHWARWKIFESYAVYHAYCNMTSCGTCKQDWYEAVVPNYFDPDDFEYSDEKEDYFLFLGRVYEGKGIHIAIQITQTIGAKLVVAGQQTLKSIGYDPVPPHVIEIGYADRETRKKLMSKAKCGIVASMYVEPFGGVQMEMLFSGTPTITTDWGSFTENNIHGVTGYRCRTFDQFCWAARNIDKIKPSDCRKWAMNFSLDKVARMYEEYFQMVHDVMDGPGWYQKHPERESLEWIQKTLAITGPEPNPIKNEETTKWIRKKLKPEIKQFYVVIPTIRKYYKALRILLNSLPIEWKYILVYQDEEDDIYKIRSDKNYEVSIKQNLYEYGSFIGVNMLLQDNLLPRDTWFLFLHDTCKTGPRIKDAIEDILLNASDDEDIIWLCNTGKCNLCLLRNVVPHGYSVYNNMQMTKQYAIEIEYMGKDSVKAFPCKQRFLDYQCLFDGPSDVYNDELYKKRVTTKFQNIDLEKYYAELPKKKVAIMSEPKWAFGRLFNSVIKYMKQWYDFEFYDWGNSEDLSRFFHRDEWKNFDIILGNSLIANDMTNIGWLPEPPPIDYLRKCISLVCTSAINHPVLREKIKYSEPLYCGVTKCVIDTVYEHYNIKCDVTPIGIDTEHFFPTREITSITRAGIIGNPDNATDIKRLDMFREICEKANIEPVFIYGKDMNLNNKLYDDIDIYIVTSLHEAVYAEAACCGIPVILANSKTVREDAYGFKTFDTVDEAISLINWLNSDISILREYVRITSETVRTNLDWKVVSEKYWKPAFEKRMKAAKVAILSETKWAFGRIHYAIIKHMKQWYDFEFYDWGNGEDCSRFFHRQEWKNFDIILGNHTITSGMVEAGWWSEVPSEYLRKCISVGHTPIMNHPNFTEIIKNRDGPLYCGVTKCVIDAVYEQYNIKCDLTPIGIDTEHFFPTREITSIKRAGVIGNPDACADIKRLDMFKEICEKANIEPVFIYEKDVNLNNKLYDGIDLFMYTSTIEGAGLGILEAACCGIPVITTKVGYSLYLKNIKTFDTVDEALDLIKWLSEPEQLKEYIKNLSNEIRTEWNWASIAEKYWRPVFKKRLTYQSKKIKFSKVPIHVLTIPQNSDRIEKMKEWTKGNMNIYMNKPLENRNLSISRGHLLIEEQVNGNVPYIHCDDDSMPVGKVPEYLEFPEDADIVCLTNSSWRSTRDSTTGEIGCFGYKINENVYRVQNMIGLSMLLVCSQKGAEYLKKSLIESISLAVPPDVITAKYQNDYNVYAFNEPFFYQSGYNEACTRIRLDSCMVPKTFDVSENKYSSQYKQDEILESTIFKGFRNGFFVDIGAHNGVTINNTLYFEKYNKWTGINVEPLPNAFAELQKNRPNCTNYNCAISNVNGTSDFIMATGPEMLSGLQEYYDPRHLCGLDWHIGQEDGSRQIVKVQTTRLEDIINVPHVHLLSIDVEGAEFEVIKSINFEKVFIDVIIFENNYSDNSIVIVDYLSKLNYLQFNKSHKSDIFMVHKDSQFIIGFQSRTYYYNNDYSKPIDLIIDKDNNVVVNSLYWDNDIGIIKNNTIQFKNQLGNGTIHENYIDFGNNNIWHKSIFAVGTCQGVDPDKFIGYVPNGSVFVFDDVWYSNPENKKLYFVQQEPEIICPYENEIIKNIDKFEKVFTFNENILKMFPEKTIRYTGNFATVSPSEGPKTFSISGWASTKIYNNAPGHLLRLELYKRQLELPNCTFFRSINRNGDGVLEEIGQNPFLGEDFFNGGKKCLFETFQFSIVLENSQQVNYYTEKLIDCLITKTIPIYWGCPNISNFFDTTGWIFFDSFDSLLTLIKKLDETYYERYTETIQKNFELAKTKSDFYKNLLYEYNSTTSLTAGCL